MPTKINYELGPMLPNSWGLFKFTMTPHIYPGLNQLDKNNFKVSCRNFSKSTDTLIQFVCDYFNVNRLYVQGKSRKREFVIPRQISMHLIKRIFPEITLEKIGAMFGSRNHATILYSIKTVNDLIDTDRKFKKQYNNIVKMM